MAFAISSPTLISDLWAFKREAAMPPGASAEHLVMFAGRDDIHGSLKAAIGSCRSSYQMNMYGMDDPELWEVVWAKIIDPQILVQITLDKSQAGGPTEKKILDLHRNGDPSDFNSHIAVGQSATHQISHTKAGVIDGVLAWHGSVNWSASGEGEGADTNPHAKSQNNSLAWFTDRLNVNAMRDQLAKEHLVAQAQEKAA